MKYFIFLFFLLMMSCGSDDSDDIVDDCLLVKVIQAEYPHCNLTGNTPRPGPLTLVKVSDSKYDTVMTYFENENFRMEGLKFYGKIIQIGDTLICNALFGHSQFLLFETYLSAVCQEKT